MIPNEKLASDTIRNSTIVDRAQRAEITVQVPLSTDLENVIELLRGEARASASLEVFVSGLDGSADDHACARSPTTRSSAERARARAPPARPHAACARPAIYA